MNPGPMTQQVLDALPSAINDLSILWKLQPGVIEASLVTTHDEVTASLAKFINQALEKFPDDRGEQVTYVYKELGFHVIAAMVLDLNNEISAGLQALE